MLDQAAGLTQALQDGANTYICGADRLAQVNPSNTQYLLCDALSSVRQLSDGNGKTNSGLPATAAKDALR